MLRVTQDSFQVAEVGLPKCRCLTALKTLQEAPAEVQRQASGNFLSRMSIYRSSSLHPDKAEAMTAAPAILAHIPDRA